MMMTNIGAVLKFSGWAIDKYFTILSIPMDGMNHRICNWSRENGLLMVCSAKHGRKIWLPFAIYALVIAVFCSQTQSHR
jgi:hypothetical protein